MPVNSNTTIVMMWLKKRKKGFAVNYIAPPIDGVRRFAASRWLSKNVPDIFIA